MLVNIYIGRSATTKGMHTFAAPVGDRAHNNNARGMATTLAQGSPIAMVTVDVPDDIFVVPPVAEPLPIEPATATITETV